jgi:hypothetical protein
LEQCAPAQESFTKDGGLEKKLFLVVKNTSFKVRLGFRPCEQKLDFHKMSVEALLLFDELGTQVPFVKKQPVTTKGRISPAGDELSFDVKITVLSSHCEGLHFRVQFRALEPHTRTSLGLATACTQPIKVLSKPDQLRPKPKAPALGSRKSRTPPARKRTQNAVVLEALARIEAQQLQILRQVAESSNRALSNPPADAMSMEVAGKLPDGQDTAGEPMCDIQLALLQLIDAWERTQASQRPQKIRRIANSCTGRQTQTFSELLEMLAASGLDLAGRVYTAPPVDAASLNGLPGLNGSRNSYFQTGGLRDSDFITPMMASDPLFDLGGFGTY